MELAQASSLQSDRQRPDLVERWRTEPGPANGGGGDAAIRFRRFHVMPGARLLLRDERPVELGGRAFDLLLVLLSRRGGVVSKNEIVDQVWPSILVDESNLRFQMARLRKALGEDRDVIKTIQGRGYLFVAETPAESDPCAPVETASSATHPGYASAGTPRQRQVLELSKKEMAVAIDTDRGAREVVDDLLRSASLCIDFLHVVQASLASGHSSPKPCFVLDVWLPGAKAPGVAGRYGRGGFAPSRRLRRPQFGRAQVRSDDEVRHVGLPESAPNPDLLRAIRFVVASLATQGRSTG